MKQTKPTLPPYLYSPPTEISPTLSHTSDQKTALWEQFTRGELRELEITIIAFRPGRNRNFMAFRPQDLPAFAASFVNMPFLRNHDEDDINSRDGIITASQFTNNAFQQTINLTTQRGIRSYLEGQIDRFSIGWFHEGATCSICQNNYFDYEHCRHMRGQQYIINNQPVTCEVVFINPRGKETSAVNVPAVQDTGLLTIHPSDTSYLSHLSDFHTLDYLDTHKLLFTQLSPLQQKGIFTMDPQQDQTTPQINDWAALARQQTINSLLSQSGLSTIGITAAQAEIDATPSLTLDQVRSLITRHQAEDQQRTQATQWVTMLQTQALDGMIASARLSPASATAVRTAVQALGNNPPIQQVQRLIDAQKAAQAELQQSPVHGIHPNQITFGPTAEQDIQNALSWLLGDTTAKAPPPSMRNIARLYVDITGDWDFHGTFKRDQSRLAAATTTTLPNMAVNALNRIILQHYQNMGLYRWFESVTAVMPHDGTTNPVQMIFMNGIADLPTVGEGAAYAESTVGDSKESLSFAKKGAFVGITLEMIRRSEIAKMQAIPKALAASSVRTRSAAIANLLTTNTGAGPNMSDGNALFHASHSNLAVTAFSYTAWGAARTECFSQSIPGTTKKLGLLPKYALIPIGLYDTALEIFGYGTGNGGKPGTPNNDANVYASDRPGDPRPMPVIIPEFSDSNDWAYVADPNLQATLCMSYIASPQGNDHPMPEIYTVSEETNGLMFTNDTMPIKVRDWFGVGVATWLGIGKRNVP